MVIKLDMLSTNRFLIIAPSWIGDLLMSQSLYKSLKANYHNCTIDVIAKPYLNDLIKLMPEVNNNYDLCIDHKEFGFSKRLKISKQLKDNNYSTAIILTNTFKSAIIPWIMNIPKRIGYKTELRSILLTKSYKLIKHEDSMVNRYLKLIDSSFDKTFRPYLNLDPDIIRKYKNKYIPNDTKKNVILCPEAEFGDTKRWPQKKWISIAKYFKDENHNVFFVGKDIESSKAYEEIIDDILITSLIGKTTLKDVAYIMSCADLVVTNDSGLMHLAASLGINLISIYGSSSPFYTPPLMKENHGEIIYKHVECSPCYKKKCPLTDDLNLKCLESITSEEVIKKSKKYLG